MVATSGFRVVVADGYDAAQARGEVAKAGQYGRANVENDNVSPATAADLAVAGGSKSMPAPSANWWRRIFQRCKRLR